MHGVKLQLTCKTELLVHAQFLFASFSFFLDVFLGKELKCKSIFL